MGAITPWNFPLHQITLKLAPFGGFGLSGLGREGCVYGLEEFLEYQAVQLPRRDSVPRAG